MKWSLILLLLIFSISYISADEISFNMGGDSNLCIDSGVDSCALNYEEIAETNPTGDVWYNPNISGNLTNKTNESIEDKIILNKTNEIIKTIDESGKKMNIWLFILIGIISILILISAVLFDISKRKINKDSILFIITSLIFSLITLILSIYYKSLYSLGLLVLVVLIFISVISLSLVFNRYKKGLDLVGAILICVSCLIFSSIMILVENYVIASITIIISLILLIISIAFLVDRS